MNRQLKKMIKECSDLSDKYFSMSMYNSTVDEQKSVLTDLYIKRKEIAYKCAELLGIKDEEDARVIAAAMDRKHLNDYVKYEMDRRH